MLSEIRGGSIRNAIPREAVAVLAFNGDVKAIESAVENLAVVLKEELAIAEPNLTLFVEFVEKSATVFTAQSTQTVINALNVLPNGVIRNSDVVKNVVESSLSVGVLKTEGNVVKAPF